MDLSVADIIAKVDALTGALTRVADNQEKLLAGQQAALDKIDSGKGTTTRTPRAKKDETPAAAAETPAAAAEPVKSFLPANVTDEATLKAHVSAWTSAVEGEARSARVATLKAIAAHFGVEPKFAPLSADPARLKQTLFFIERSKAGEKIDFSADYDFDGDPAQGAAAAATGDDSDFG